MHKSVFFDGAKIKNVFEIMKVYLKNIAAKLALRGRKSNPKGV
jgi:hypothetical protein